MFPSPVFYWKPTKTWKQITRCPSTIAIEETLVEIQGFVVRSLANPEGMYESGIRFSEVSEEELNVLKAYIVAFEEELA